MAVQERLLLEQIGLVYGSELGRKVIGPKKPTSVQEFRDTVPLTTYDSYEPYLTEQREEALVEKPYMWMHTSGRSGRFKWIPYTTRALDVSARFALGSVILAAASKKGEVNLRPGQRMLLLVAPRPYFTGCALYYMAKERFSLEVIPSIEATERMDFQERVALGFAIAMREGFDHMFALASLLSRLGETMANHAKGMSLTSVKDPRAIYRGGRAWLRAKRQGRTILPFDLWQPKSIMTGGTDAKVYGDQIAHYWGRKPYEGYGATETYVLAVQGWTKKNLTFVPSMAFWEFIPEDERRREQQNPSYQPKTVLTNELVPGREYEVVLTHFYGMPLLRYRMGDIIRVEAARDEEANVNLPQAMFRSRVGDIIQLAGLTEIDERTLWQAVIDSGIKINDWSARKELDRGQAYLHIYLELAHPVESDHIEQAIDQRLRALDVDYRDLGDQLGQQPVRVTLLAPGTFGRYYQEMKAEGAELAHLKPPHMNPSDAIVAKILRLGGRSVN